jgi:hypothetical protein
VKGTWREGSWLGTLEDRWKRLWRGASISIGAPLGNLEGDSSYRGLGGMDESALGLGRFSLKRLTAEGLEGGFLYWGPWKIC